MNALEALLAERNRIIKELSDLENLLRSRFRWSGGHEGIPTNNAELHVAPGLPSENVRPAEAGHRANRASSINYSEEAKEWLAHAPQRFTVLDFREFLVRKHGAGVVNPSSLNGPIKRLVDEKLLVVVEQGKGRRPTYYRLKGEQENA